eukprot:3040059-Pleurochrysis_carterae.AAC.1
MTDRNEEGVPLHHAEEAGLYKNSVQHEPAQKSYHCQVLVLAAGVVKLNRQTSSETPPMLSAHNSTGTQLPLI